LAHDPEDERRNADRRRLEKGRVRKIVWEEHHVPEEVLEEINVNAGLVKRYSTYLACADLVEGNECKGLR
jgi:hypothetical protein